MYVYYLLLGSCYCFLSSLQKASGSYIKLAVCKSRPLSSKCWKDYPQFVFSFCFKLVKLHHFLCKCSHRAWTACRATVFRFNHADVKQLRYFNQETVIWLRTSLSTDTDRLSVTTLFPSGKLEEKKTWQNRDFKAKGETGIQKQLCKSTSKCVQMST